MDVTIYLIGDGVLCAKRNQTGHVGHHVHNALSNGVQVVASRDDLLARGLAETQVEQGVEMVDDIEGMIVTDVMEHADRVISW
jgi:sulfur relay protein TusB/DsrH